VYKTNRRKPPPLLRGGWRGAPAEGGGVTGTTGTTRAAEPGPAAAVGRTRCWTTPAGVTLGGPVANEAGDEGGGAASDCRQGKVRQSAGFLRAGADGGAREQAKRSSGCFPSLSLAGVKDTYPTRLLDGQPGRTKGPLGERHAKRAREKGRTTGRRSDEW
jgi:hypothetical protein